MPPSVEAVRPGITERHTMRSIRKKVAVTRDSKPAATPRRLEPVDEGAADEPTALSPTSEADAFSGAPQWFVDPIAGTVASLKTSTAGHMSVVGARPTIEVLKQLRAKHADLTGQKYGADYRRSLHACSDWLEPRGVHELTFQIRRAASSLGVCIGVQGGGGSSNKSKSHGAWGLNMASGMLIHAPKVHNLDPIPVQGVEPLAEIGLAEEGVEIVMRVNFKRRLLAYRANNAAWMEAKFPPAHALPTKDSLRPWVLLRPCDEATRPGDSVMLISYVPAQTTHRRALDSLEGAIASVEPQLAKCHAAPNAAAAAAEVKKLALAALTLAEALEGREAIIDPKGSAALIGRATALQEEVLSLQQAGERLKEAVDLPLDTEPAIAGLGKAIAAARTAGLADAALLAQADERLQAAKEASARAAREVLSRMVDVPLADVDVTALEGAVERARAAGVRDLAGGRAALGRGEERVKEARKLLGVRERLRVALGGLKKGGGHGAAMLASVIEAAKKSGAAGEELVEAEKALHVDTAKRAAAERLGACMDPELDADIEAGMKQLQEACDAAKKAGVPEAPRRAAASKLQAVEARRQQHDDLLALTDASEEELDVERLQALLVETQSLVVSHYADINPGCLKAQCHRLHLRATVKLEAARVAQRIKDELAAAVAKLRKRFAGQPAYAHLPTPPCLRLPACYPCLLSLPAIPACHPNRCIVTQQPWCMRAAAWCVSSVMCVCAPWRV